MYLTHMPLNPDRRSTRELLSSPQRLHAAVLAAFPPGTAHRGRILWRLDAPERHRLDLYVVSPSEPSLEAMADQAGWPSQPVWRTADYQPFLAALEGTQRWAFRVRANPIKNVRPESGARGRRVAILEEPAQAEWLLSRAASHGFAVTPSKHGPNLRVTERRTERFTRRGAQSVTLGTAAYEGVLEVLDPTLLRATLTQGIGSAKGYGCGLMTLAPVS